MKKTITRGCLKVLKRKLKFRKSFLSLNQVYKIHRLSRDDVKKLIRDGSLVQGDDYRRRFTLHTEQIELNKESIPKVRQMICGGIIK